MSPEESEWLELRRDNTIDPMRDFLGRMNIPDFDAPGYIDTHRDNVSALPNVAVAASGGGYRALMNGAGAVSAFDSRTPDSTSSGHLGGLLQLATYFSGLSGGAWLVGSIYVNNFTTIQDLQSSESAPVYDLEQPLFKGPSTDGFGFFNTLDYFNDIQEAVSSKAAAGFNVSITDYWGRGLSYQLVEGADGGPGITWSSIARDTEFAAGRAPMPIVIADKRDPGEKLRSSNTTVFEFNPWEMGTFDPTVFGFAPLRYLGTAFSAGSVPDDESCVRGFDNAGFVMGTSSSLFNFVLMDLEDNDAIPEIFRSAVGGLVDSISDDNNDIADYRPNPFYFFNNDTNPIASSKSLTLVDGGLDLQNIPLHPLIQPTRNVDVVFAVDSSADASNWPNGTALVATYERSMNEEMSNGTAFPAIPDQSTFVNLGLNARPTFFGCDSGNLTGPAPLVVYLPNAPYVFLSNVSTEDPDHTRAERDAIILNGYNVVTQGNSTQDPDWPACVGCAILSRSLERTGTEVPSICQTCFERYCWDGTRNSTTPAPYLPSLGLEELEIETSGATTFHPPGGCSLALFTFLLAMAFVSS